MPTRPQQPLTLAELEQLLDVYGADRTRWPLASRAGAAALLAASADARQLLAEAAALDTVLMRADAQAPGDAAMASMAERILSAAASSPRLAAVSERPATLAIAAPPVHLSRPSAARVASDWWRGVAVLAASLIIGVFVGQTQIGAQALPQLAALTGSSLSAAERIALTDFDVEATDVD